MIWLGWVPWHIKYCWLFNAKSSLYICFFIIHRVKARTIPYPHQPPARDDNKVSVVQGGTATPGATNQLLPLDKVF